MLYDLVRPIARIALHIYFRRIQVSGAESLPAKGPVLLACNHPTAFIEPCLLACEFPRALHFVTRGDIFRSRVYAWLLRQLHMWPIYRFRDGYENIKRNDASLKEIFRIFSEGSCVLIMAEGRTRHGKTLGGIQKGPARIALQWQAEHPETPLRILPVGINYSHALKPRSEVGITLGNALETQAWLPVMHNDPVLAVRQLTQELERSMQELVIHVPDVRDEKYLDVLFDILHARQMQKSGDFSRPLSRPMVRLARHFAGLEPEEKAEWRRVIQKLRLLLKRNRLQIRDLYAKPGKLRPIWFVFKLFGLLPCLPAVLAYAPPLQICQRYAWKNIRSREFKQSVFIGLSIPVSLGVFLILALAGMYLSPLSLPGLYCISSPAWAYAGLRLIESLQRDRRAMRYHSLDPEVRKMFELERKACEQLAHAAESFS